MKAKTNLNIAPKSVGNKNFKTPKLRIFWK